MRIRCNLCSAFVVLLFLCPPFSTYSIAGEQRQWNKYVCSDPHPQSMCNASNICGSTSAPCTVDVKRTAGSTSITPSIVNVKENAPFCVQPGTTLQWKSSAKNTGFLVDFGPESPFETEAIIGGSDRSPSVVATKVGCYKFSAGACVSGAVYGMCDSVDTELIVMSGK